MFEDRRERTLWILAALAGLLTVLLPLGSGGADYIGVRIVYLGLPLLSLLVLAALGGLVEARAFAVLLGVGALLVVKEYVLGIPEGTAMALLLASGWLLTAATATLTRRYSTAVLLLLRSVSASVLLVSVWALLGLFGIWFEAGAGGRAVGPFFLPNALAGYLDLGVFVTAAALFYERRVMLIPRLFHFLALGAGVAALAASGSRGGWAAAAAGLAVCAAVWWLYSPGPEATGSPEPDADDRKSGWQTWLAAGAGLAAVLLLALPPVREVLFERAGHLFTALDYSLRGRMIYWGAAVELLQQNPLSGIGFDQFRYFYTQVQPDWRFYATDPHSGVLNLSLGTGVPLALAWAGSLGYLIYRSLGRLTSAWRIALLGGLSAFFLHANIDFDLTIPAIVVLASLCFGIFLGTSRRGDSWQSFLPEDRLPAGWVLTGIAVLLVGAAGWFGWSWQQSERAYREYRTRQFRQSGDQSPEDIRNARELLLEAYRATPDRHELGKSMLSFTLNRPGGGSLPEAWPAPDELSRRLVRRVPDDPEARYLRGWFLWSSAGSVSEARKQFDRALELAPRDYPPHYFHYLRLLERRGEEAEATRVRLKLWRNIPLETPMTEQGVRPKWSSYNQRFAGAWRELLEAAERGEADLNESELDRLREAVENFSSSTNVGVTLDPGPRPKCSAGVSLRARSTRYGLHPDEPLTGRRRGSGGPSPTRFRSSVGPYC